MKNLAIVIGGSSGIGQAIIEELSKQYIVVNMSRSINRESNNIIMDVCNIGSVKNGFNTLIKNIGSPSVMVYCAGFVEPQGLLEISEYDWNKTIDTNLSGAFYCTKEFVKICDKNKESKIIYIASTSGTRPQVGWSAYSSSKAGLINFALTMSEELTPYGIKAYCVSPGRCATNLRRKLAPNENQDTIMQPLEVASFVSYLINSDNVLNGQNIIVKKDIIGGI